MILTLEAEVAAAHAVQGDHSPVKPTTRPSCDRHPHQSVVVAAVPHLACLEPSMQRALLFLVPAALVMAWQPMSSSILTHSLGHCPLVHPVPYLFLVQLTVSSRGPGIEREQMI